MYALLIIDMQNDFAGRIPPAELNSIVSAQSSLGSVFERYGLTTIFVVTEHNPDGSDALKKSREENFIPAVRGSSGARIVPGLCVPRGSARITKTKYSAFHGTSLRRVLGDFDGTLVLAGINTHACVRSTAIDGYQWDWDIIVLSDCVASYDPFYHKDTLSYIRGRIGRVMSSKQLCDEIAMLMSP